jgi:hypothetical protein
MKRSAISFVVLSIAVLALVATVSGVYRVPQTRRPTAPPALYEEQMGAEDARAPAPGTTARQRSSIDPNKVKAAIMAFKGLEDELKQVDTKGKSKMGAWLSEKEDNKLALLKGVDDQVGLELALLRKLATEEGAKKTVAAIDAILLDRELRQETVIDRMREQRREQSRTTPVRRTRSRYDTRSRYQQGTGTGGAAGGQYQYDESAEQENTRRSPRRR